MLLNLGNSIKFFYKTFSAYWIRQQNVTKLPGPPFPQTFYFILLRFIKNAPIINNAPNFI